MDANRSAIVSFSLYDYGHGTKRPHPRDIYMDVNQVPTSTKWVPQSMMDSIWVLYEFASERDRDEFISHPPASFDAARVSKETQDFFDHWGR